MCAPNKGRVPFVSPDAIDSPSASQPQDERHLI
jgi:hypothetical protein